LATAFGVDVVLRAVSLSHRFIPTCSWTVSGERFAGLSMETSLAGGDAFQIGRDRGKPL
jgi:hypothetical protein